jgi:predicted ATPase
LPRLSASGRRAAAVVVAELRGRCCAGVPHVHEAATIGSVARRVSSPQFVGRAAEVETLDALLVEAAAGRPAIALIEGDAGVGKTRLLAELAARAQAAGALVLRGDCIDMPDGELPFAPLVAALRQLAQVLAPDALDAAVGPGRAELAHLLPDLGEPGEVLADTALGPVGQQRLFERLLGLLRRLGEEHPVVLLIEDLHWADGSSRDLITFLVRNLRAERVLLATTHRGDELHRRHPLRPFLRELARSSAVQRLALAPLGEHEVAAQLEGILGEPPSAELLASVASRAEGNPFFVEEIVSAADDGDGELPATLRDALMLRIEGLDDDAQAVLGAVSVAGHAVDHELLEAVSGTAEDALFDALRQAISHHVLVTRAGGRVRIRLPPCAHARGGLRRPAPGSAHTAASRVRTCARRAAEAWRRRSGGAHGARARRRDRRGR